MTQTTETVRSQSFLPLEADIPPGLTIAEYRASRRRSPRRARRRRVPARRRSG